MPTAPTLALRLLLVAGDDAATLADALSGDPAAAHDVRRIRPADALREAAEHGADAVVLDLAGGSPEGFALLSRLAAEIPEAALLALVGPDEETVAADALRQGVDEILAKGPQLAFAPHAVRYAVDRHRLRATLRSLALVDELTGLHNRRGFHAFAEHDLRLARRMGRPVALFFLDVCGMRAINAGFGAELGDAAIRRAAEILRRTFRETDVIGRLGGDEFTVLALNVGPADVQALRTRLAERTIEAGADGALPFTVTLRMAAAVHDGPGACSLQELLLRADQAMRRQARRQGGGPIE